MKHLKQFESYTKKPTGHGTYIYTEDPQEPAFSDEEILDIKDVIQDLDDKYQFNDLVHNNIDNTRINYCYVNDVHKLSLDKAIAGKEWNGSFVDRMDHIKVNSIVTSAERTSNITIDRKNDYVIYFDLSSPNITEETKSEFLNDIKMTMQRIRSMGFKVELLESMGPGSTSLTQGVIDYLILSISN